MSVGFAQALDVDLSLSASDKEDCMMEECSSEAVMEGVTTLPCGCPQTLCLAHYEREKPHWWRGDSIGCYRCRPLTLGNLGEFLYWTKL